MTPNIESKLKLFIRILERLETEIDNINADIKKVRGLIEREVQE